MTSKMQLHARKQPAAGPNRPPVASAVPAAAVDPDAAAARASTARQRKTVPTRAVAADPKTEPRPKASSPTRQATPPAPAPKPATAGASKKSTKPRPVLVRDSFTMPEADFALIAKLKATALGGKRAAKKSELLRAGLQLLAGLDAESLVVVLNRLIAVKTGRPKKGH